MAPEQLTSARVDARADIYAYAVAVWEGLHGEHPFQATDFISLRASVLAGRLHEPASSKVPRRLRRALAAAMRPDPERRPQTLEPLLAELVANPGRRLARLALAALATAAVILLGAGGRALLEARRPARAADDRAAVANRLGQEVKEMELGLRAERLLPLHDVGPAEARVRVRLGEMRALLDGSAADAVVHDAIGRGRVAVGDYPRGPHGAGERAGQGGRRPGAPLGAGVHVDPAS